MSDLGDAGVGPAPDAEQPLGVGELVFVLRGGNKHPWPALVVSHDDQRARALLRKLPETPELMAVPVLPLFPDGTISDQCSWFLVTALTAVFHAHKQQHGPFSEAEKAEDEALFSVCSGLLSSGRLLAGPAPVYLTAATWAAARAAHLAAQQPPSPPASQAAPLLLRKPRPPRRAFAPLAAESVAVPGEVRVLLKVVPLRDRSRGEALKRGFPPAMVAEAAEWAKLALLVTEAGVGSKRRREAGPHSASPLRAAPPPATSTPAGQPPPVKKPRLAAARPPRVPAAPAGPAAPAVLRAVASALPFAAPSDDASQTLPTLWAEIGALAPNDVLRGADAGVWGALRAQGAVMLRAAGTWDARRGSALLDLSFMRRGSLQLRTLGRDYQYIRQTLPHPATGVVDSFEDAIPPARLNAECPFAALVEGIEEEFRVLATPQARMPVAAREAFHLAAVRGGWPLQHAYLQGVALQGLTKGVASGVQKATPAAGPHAWDPSALAECPGSLLRPLLHACEAACNPAKMPAPAPHPPRSAAQDAAAELAATGAVAVAVDAEAAKRRAVRREAGLAAEGPPTGAKKLRGKPVAAAAPTQQVAPPAAAPPPPPLRVPELGDPALRLWGAGIVTPWLYFMGVGSSFAAHFEDYAFGSANVIVAQPGTQAWVIWYSVPREDLAALHAFLRATLGAAYTLDCLESRRLWLDPARIAAWNAGQGAEARVRVYRHVQGPGDYVVTDYGSVHWGVNLGVGWKVAVNFAYEEWEPAARQVDEVYRSLEAATGATRQYRCAPDFESPRCAGKFGAARLAAMAGRHPAPEQPLEAREAAGAAAVRLAFANMAAGVEPAYLASRDEPVASKREAAAPDVDMAVAPVAVPVALVAPSQTPEPAAAVDVVMAPAWDAGATPGKAPAPTLAGSPVRLAPAGVGEAVGGSFKLSPVRWPDAV